MSKPIGWKRVRRQAIELTCLAAIGCASGCALALSGNPERDQAKVVAATRTAAVKKGAADAAAEQRDDAEDKRTVCVDGRTDCDRDK